MELLRTPKVMGNFGYDVKDEAPVHTYYQFTQDELPREFMDQLQAIRGDGTNRVALTTDFGIKDFGTGPSGSCTISISCGSTDVELAAAVELASRWSIFYAKSHYERAEQEMRSMLMVRGHVLSPI